MEGIFPPFLAFCVWLLLFFTNFRNGKTLLGWDGLYFELNKENNLKRAFSSTWDGFQGIGYQSAHATEVDIPHILLRLLINILVDDLYNRYVFIMLLALVGTLGMYFLVKYLLQKHSHKRKYARYIALVSSIFYLINVGTVQHFIVIFEMFAFQFAFLPWIFLIIEKKIEKPKSRKFSILLLFVSFISSAMAYAYLLWIALFAGLLVFLVSKKLIHKDIKIWNVIKILILFIIANLYWILPTLFFINESSNLVSKSRSNIVFSEEAAQINQKNNSLENLLINKGFLFDWSISNDSNGFEGVMDNWNLYMQNTYVQLSIVIVAFMILIGVILSLRKHNKNFLPYTALFIFAFLMLLSQWNPIQYLIANIELLNEAFRFSYTKFSILLYFTQSILVACSLSAIFNNLDKINLRIFRYVLLVLPLLFIFLAYGIVFRGNFVHKQMFVELPNEYTQLFDYFGNIDKDSRIGYLPVKSAYGWQYNEWGYQGSGFLWYGIEQPILDRDFDRWNPYLDDYYRRVTDSIYSLDDDGLIDTFGDYNVEYVIVDKSAVYPPSLKNEEELGIKNFYEIAHSKSDRIEKVKEFGFIEVYKLQEDESDEGNNSIYDQLSFDIKQEKYIFENNSLRFSSDGASDRFFVDNYKEYYLLEIVYQDNFITVNVQNNLLYSSKTNSEDLFINNFSVGNLDGKFIYFDNQLFEITNNSSWKSNKLYTFDDLQKFNLTIFDKVEKIKNIDLTDCQGKYIESINFNEEVYSNQKFSSNQGLCLVNNDVNDLSKDLFVEVKIDFEYIDSWFDPSLCLLTENGKCNLVENKSIQSYPKEEFVWNFNNTGKQVSINIPSEKDFQIDDFNISLFSKEKIHKLDLRDIQNTDVNLVDDNGFIINLGSPVQVVDANQILLSSSKLNNCEARNLRNSNISVKKVDDHVEISNSGGGFCFEFKIDELENEKSYLFKINGENRKGVPLLYKFIDPSTSREIFASRLGESSNLFILNKNQVEEISIYFEDQSFGFLESLNALNSIEIYEIDINLIKNIKLENKQISLENQICSGIKKKASFIYSVEISSPNCNFSYGETKSSGWLLFPKNFEQLSISHLLDTEGWEGTYELDIGEYILIYYPQIVSYFGLVVFLLSLYIEYTILSVKWIRKMI